MRLLTFVLLLVAAAAAMATIFAQCGVTSVVGECMRLLQAAQQRHGPLGLPKLRPWSNTRSNPRPNHRERMADANARLVSANSFPQYLSHISGNDTGDQRGRAQRAGEP